MVLLDTVDAYLSELERMFTLCKERGAGTVYCTLKQIEAQNKEDQIKGRDERKGPGGRREGWLARAKISNKKTRKISVLVRICEVSTVLYPVPLFLLL